MNHTDTELIARLNIGDQTAFEIIYRSHARNLFRYARRIITNKEDCEEVIQDIFTSLWQRRESLRITSLRYYLLNAVRYKVIRYIQHNSVKKKYAAHFRFFETLYDSIYLEEQQPESILDRLLETIEALPKRCQEAIKLRIQENLSNVEIAERMSIDIRTVETYMLKAYTLFRSCYDKIYKIE